ncbi:MAG: beta-galactosidase trimerization domain-containing protein [Puniceicoccaceae bacterium]
MTQRFQLSILALVTTSASLQSHDFLHELYDELHNSPRQEQFRKIRPMPAGVVYIQWPGEGEKEMREHFRLIKKLGFNCLKQIMTIPGWTLEEVQLIALDEGLVPWWYDDGGWEPITDELLGKLGIPVDTAIADIRNDPRMQTHQKEVMRQRILKAKAYRAEHGNIPRGSMTAYDPTVGGRGLDLTDEGRRLFVNWAMKTYPDIDTLNEAWTLHHHGTGHPFDSWDDFKINWEVKPSHRNYKNKMEILRFKAEHGAGNIRERAVTFRNYDSSVPFRGGGEMGLFLPAAYMGVDMEIIADVVKDFGSFYPSTHLSWHFNLTNNEIVRPFYIQASIMNDFNKGGWTGGWESTGGPQQFDGEKGATDLNSYFVDGGTILQLYMSQMAAGFRGFGIWCWSIRSAGKEGGEYALLDRNNQPTDRAIRLGMMGKAMQKYRDEIWESRKEPVVGVLLDWNNDAAWGAMSVRGRDSLRDFPIKARIGAARALMNANVPFEYVTPDDLANGLADRYQVIYLPSVISLRRDMLDTLDGYVQRGGRLVLDLPGGKFDENTAILPTGTSSPFAKIFGLTLDNYQFSGSNKTLSLMDTAWTGFVADMTPASAVVKEYYNSGKPAITENRYGKGTAAVIGLDIAYQSFVPGNALAEQILVDHVLGAEITSPYSCEGALVYRRAGKNADHYFFITDGLARTVSFRSTNKYKSAVDALTGEAIDLNAIRLNADDAKWVRMEK